MRIERSRVQHKHSYVVAQLGYEPSCCALRSGSLRNYLAEKHLRSQGSSLARRWRLLQEARKAEEEQGDRTSQG